MVVDAPLVGIGRHNLDFGSGFYVTDIEEQAISWATRPVNGSKPNNQICIISQQIADDYLHFVEAIDLRKEVEHG